MCVTITKWTILVFNNAAAEPNRTAPNRTEPNLPRSTVALKNEDDGGKYDRVSGEKCRRDLERQRFGDETQRKHQQHLRCWIYNRANVTETTTTATIKNTTRTTTGQLTTVLC